MRISELKNGQAVRYRLGRALISGGEHPAWQEGAIGVTTRRNHVGSKAGVVALSVGTADFAPEHDYVPPHSFVASGGEDYPHGYFMAEEFFLEIFGIEPGWKFAS